MGSIQKYAVPKSSAFSFFKSVSGTDWDFLLSTGCSNSPISLFGFVLLVFYNRGLSRTLSLLFCLHCVLYGQPVSPIICHFQKTTLQHSHPLHAMKVQLWWWVRLCICVLILTFFFVTRSNTINACIKRLSENVWYPRV